MPQQGEDRGGKINKGGSGKGAPATPKPKFVPTKRPQTPSKPAKRK